MRKKLAIEPPDWEAGPDLFGCRESPDECFGPLCRRGMPLREGTKWSSLALSVALHCALAFVFYSVAGPQPAAPHNWIEVQLVGACPGVAGDGTGAATGAMGPTGRTEAMGAMGAAGAGGPPPRVDESKVCDPMAHEPVLPSPDEAARTLEEKPVHTAEAPESVGSTPNAGKQFAEAKPVHTIEAPEGPPTARVKKRTGVKKTAETHARGPKEEFEVKPETREAEKGPALRDPNPPAAGEGTAAGHGGSPGDGSGPPGRAAGPGTGVAQGSVARGGGPVEVAFGSPGGPRFLRKMMPAYPPFARRQEMEGAVLLRVTIDAEGRVVQVEVLKRAGFGFDEAALKAIRESTFIPAMRDGKSSSCIALLPVRFELKSPGRK